MSARHSIHGIILMLSVLCQPAAYGQQQPPLSRPEIRRPAALTQIPTPAKLEEFRRVRVRLPASITRVEVTEGICAAPGRTLRIYGTGFGATSKGRSLKIVRRLELGNLRVASWSPEIITATIPANVAGRSFYEVVLTESGRWVSNLARVGGCGEDVTLAPGGVTARAAGVDPLLSLFPRETCRDVNLDTLDITYTDERRSGGTIVFRIVDDRGTVVSFSDWSYDQSARAFFYILDNWLTSVCYGPRMGNYNYQPTYRLMFWTDRLGQVPRRSDDFLSGLSECYGCAEHTLNRQFNHCRAIPRLTELEFARVEAGIRDTRTPQESVPWSVVPIWGIRRSFVRGPRTFYSVADWPLFTSEPDVRWAKRYFSRPSTLVCTFGAFNDGPSDRIRSEEHDGMQIIVR